MTALIIFSQTEQFHLKPMYCLPLLFCSSYCGCKSDPRHFGIWDGIPNPAVSITQIHHDRQMYTAFHQRWHPSAHPYIISAFSTNIFICQWIFSPVFSWKFQGYPNDNGLPLGNAILYDDWNKLLLGDGNRNHTIKLR